MQHISLIEIFTSFAMLGAEWVMWLLLALSLLCMAVIAERLLYFRSLRDDLDALADAVNAALCAGREHEARARLERSPAAAALVALSGLDERRGPSAAERTMASSLARVRPALERNLGILGTVGATAPFIGLLGTVIGIVQAFDALKTPAGLDGAAAAAANAAATGRVMGTIAEALVATAIGLAVAIPAVIAFNFLSRRIKLILASTEVLTQLVMAHALGSAEARAGGERAVQRSALQASAPAAGSDADAVGASASPAE